MATDSTLDPLMTAVVRDCSNRSLLACLGQILAEPQRLLKVADSAYRHQLGFLKFVLMSDASGRALRLHVWDSNASVVEDVHSHCAEFVSRVVSGALEERHYRLAPGDRFTRFRYRFDAATGHAVAHADGSADVIEERATLLNAGTIYQRDAYELHAVEKLSGNAMTVSAWGPRVDEAVVIKPADARAEECAASAGMPPDAVEGLLMNIYRSLHAAT